MSVRGVRCGPAGHAALIELVAERQGADPLARLTVIAPTSRSAIHLRRLVAREIAGRSGRSGVANVTFVVLRRLCEEIAGDALRALDRRPLSRVSLEGACRRVIGSFPTTLPRTAPTVVELADRYVELRSTERSTLDVLRRRGGLAAELSDLADAVRAMVEPTHYDDVDLYEEAGRIAHLGSLGTGPVIVYAPERITPSVRRLHDALARHTPVDVLIAETGDALADAPFFDGFVGAPSPVGDRFASIVRAPDAPSEVQEAVRYIRRRIESGVRPESLAVVYSRRQPYADLLATALDTAGIVWSGPAPDRLTAAVGAQLLLALVRVVADSVERRDLIAVLVAASPRPGHSSDQAIGAFDRVTRRIGLVSATFEEWANRAETDFGSSPPSSTGGESGGATNVTGARQRRDARPAGELAAAVRAIGGHVEVLRASRSWGGAAAALRASLTALLGSEESRVGWAGRAGESERLVLNVLEEIAALDRIEPYEGPGALAAALERALERDAPQVGRLGFGVVVGPLEHASGLALDAVIVLGCVEGDLPGRTAVSPLLSIADRDASGLESRSATASVGRDRRRLLLALGGANAAVASAPLADARTGRERMISRFLDGGPPVREVDSESGRLRELDTEEATAPIEVLLAGLLRGAGAHGSVGPLVEGNPGLARAVTRATSRRDEVCGPYDGAAEGTVALEIVAPTTIEQFAVCPFRFFVDHVLRAEVIDEPERRLSISPADRGLAMHEVLEAYVRQRIDGTLAQSDAERAGALVTIADRVFRRLERFGLTGKSILWEIERRRMLANLERERRLDEERLARSGAEPIAVELAFGREDVRGPTVAVLGRSIEFRGFIDRIDRRPDGGLEVIDYKSGSPRSYQRRGEDPVSRGRHLQLPVYALAAQSAFGGEATRATYRFIGDDPVEVDFRLDEAGAGHFSHALEVLVGAIDAGRFPYRPGEGDRANCRGCDFDVVCPSDRSERWVAERVDARSAAYVGLVAPHADRCPDLAVDAGEEES